MFVEDICQYDEAEGGNLAIPCHIFRRISSRRQVAASVSLELPIDPFKGPLQGPEHQFQTADQVLMRAIRSDCELPPFALGLIDLGLQALYVRSQPVRYLCRHQVHLQLGRVDLGLPVDDFALDKH